MEKTLYKILVRKDVKHIIEFRIKSITSKTITYYPTNRDNVGTKRVDVQDLDVLKVSEEITEMVAYIYTTDKSKIEEYQNSCINAFVKNVEDYSKKLNDIVHRLVDVKWDERLINTKDNKVQL